MCGGIGALTHLDGLRGFEAIKLCQQFEHCALHFAVAPAAFLLRWIVGVVGGRRTQERKERK
jgi:hypothetical protein